MTIITKPKLTKSMKLIDQIFQTMNSAKERIVKTMQERGIKKLNLVMTLEEYAKKVGIEEPDDYDEYCNEEAPYVVIFDKWCHGIDWRVDSVELKVDDKGHPCFEMNCYNGDDGDETFFDYEATDANLMYIYDVMMQQLGIDDDPEYVWVFTAEQAWDGEVADTIVKAFPTEDAAVKYLHDFLLDDGGDESIRDYVKRKNWEVDTDEPMHYCASEEMRYGTDHIELTITKCEIQK